MSTLVLVLSANALRKSMGADEILGIVLDFICQWLGFYLFSPRELSQELSKISWLKQLKILGTALNVLCFTAIARIWKGDQDPKCP